MQINWLTTISHEPHLFLLCLFSLSLCFSCREGKSLITAWCREKLFGIWKELGKHWEFFFLISQRWAQFRLLIIDTPEQSVLAITLTLDWQEPWWDGKASPYPETLRWAQAGLGRPAFCHPAVRAPAAILKLFNPAWCSLHNIPTSHSDS